MTASSNKKLNLKKISSLDDIKALETTPLSEQGLPCSTYELFVQSAKRWGNRPALTYLPCGEIDEKTKTLSYQELLNAITQMANGLHQLQVQSETTVSMLLPNLLETHITMWGAEAAGIANPINPMLEAEHIAAIMNEAKTRVLVTLAPDRDRQLWQKVEDFRAQVPTLAYVITIGNKTEHLDNSTLDFQQFIDEQPSDRLRSERIFNPEDIASYFHTGGTTGTPKLAPHTQHNEVVSAFQILTAMHLTEGERILCGLPLFHVNAVFVTGLTPWLAGGEVILATAGGYRTPAVIENFWAIVEHYQINYFSVVPTIITALMNLPNKKYNLSSLKAALCGAAPLSVELIRKFEESTGLVVLEGYGQTEGTAATTVNPRFGDRKVGSVGLRLPYCDIRIVEVDSNGRALRDCNIDEAGVIAISGANVFNGYKQDAQNSGQWIEDGWFNTGDLGCLDRDGYLWLTGRSKDLIIRGGHNIDPQMIEEAYYKHEAVIEAVALGKPDKRVGELPIIVLQMLPNSTITEQELLTHGMNHITERAAVPKEVHLVNSMPLTAVGKVHKPTLRNALIQQQINHELTPLLKKPFTVTVTQDKQQGQCVTVNAAKSEHDAIQVSLSDYSFKLVLNSHH